MVALHCCGQHLRCLGVEIFVYFVSGICTGMLVTLCLECLFFIFFNFLIATMLCIASV